MTAVLFLVLLFLFFINVPIAVSLGMASIIFFIMTNDVPLITLPQTMFAALDSFPLMAAPFFILAGKLMEHGGISERLVEFSKSLVGHIKGGLAHVSIVTCIFFAAISGSAQATTAAVGAILIASMVKEGYDRSFSSAVQAAGGTTGIVIPPSVPLILYGVSAGVSITDLFIAGIVPGILLGVSLMVVAYVISKKQGYRAAASSASAGEVWAAFKKAIFALLMPVIILGGIYGGIFTPTEAAVVAVVYGFVIGFFVYKDLDIKRIKQIFIESSITSSIILFIIATASFFGFLVTSEQMPQSMADALLGLDLSPIILVLLLNLALLVVGTFMETLASIIILTPLLLPIATNIGIDPIHFGIIMVVNLSIGLITPPVGMNLFISAQVGQTNYADVVRAIMPFLCIMIINLIIVTFLPAISSGLVP
ncbi:C4-dicarboxylate transporter, DctM subunit [Alteribacillus persepolensis]|uniref:C4-dicarboxylate transporter, DctM subunit n=1 Tax=Alteribacillus persepolensis TaxID=568899 RepID=A0A1G8KAH5_9BACI|nr:TRAP transporter large permease [Alteribacillus persepolensis]SDI40349.1 C4-dicarboxylate transporter, DctM subunit [Alteribacillus persepolensis]